MFIFFLMRIWYGFLKKILFRNLHTLLLCNYYYFDIKWGGLKKVWGPKFELFFFFWNFNVSKSNLYGLLMVIFFFAVLYITKRSKRGQISKIFYIIYDRIFIFHPIVTFFFLIWLCWKLWVVCWLISSISDSFWGKLYRKLSQIRPNFNNYFNIFIFEK